MDKTTLLHAYDRGRDARTRGHFRASPFYREMRFINGRTVDITSTLERYWLAGFDGHPFPSPEEVVL